MTDLSFAFEIAGTNFKEAELIQNRVKFGLGPSEGMTLMASSSTMNFNEKHMQTKLST